MNRYRVVPDSVAGRKCLVVYRYRRPGPWAPILTIWEREHNRVMLGRKTIPVSLETIRASEGLTALLDTLYAMGATWQQKADAVYQFLLQLEEEKDEPRATDL